MMGILKLATLLATSLLASSGAEANSLEERQMSGSPPNKTWFSFGDSYSQTWFNVSDPAGQPNLDNAFGNPPYPGYTACGFVPNWVYYSTFVYNSSFVYAYNHAYGGAVINDTLVTPWKEGLKHLYAQIDDFLDYNAEGEIYYNGWTPDDTIFLFFIGINDIGNTFYLTGDRFAFNDVLMDNYFQLVEKVVAVGAKNFLFITVPPIERSPLQQVNSDEAGRVLEHTVIADYNEKLAVKAKALEAAHPGVMAMVYDTEPRLNYILDHPTEFGVPNATAYGDGDQYAWCNDYHVSPVVNNEWAKEISAILNPRFI